MDDPIQKLIRDLQSESCPPAVLERVNRRLPHRSGPRLSWRTSLAWAGASALLILSAVVLGHRTPFLPTPATDVALLDPIPSPDPIDDPTAHRARIRDQALGALQIVGLALVDAADHTGNILRETAVPPLRNSLQSAKNRILTNP